MIPKGYNVVIAIENVIVNDEVTFIGLIGNTNWDSMLYANMRPPEVRHWVWQDCLKYRQSIDMIVGKKYSMWLVTFSQCIPQVDFLSWESISDIVNIIHRFHFHRPVVITPVLRPSFVRTWSFQSMENESWHGTSLSQVATVYMTHGTLADAPVARYSNHWCNQCRTSGTGGITTGSRVLGYLAIGFGRNTPQAVMLRYYR